MNKADKQAITSAFYQLSGVYRDIDRAHEQATQEERAHRRMGRGMYDTRDGRPSVDICAMYFALKGFTRPFSMHSVEHRLDFVCAYSAARAAKRHDPKRYRAFVRKVRPLIDRLEYPFTKEGAK